MPTVPNISTSDHQLVQCKEARRMIKFAKKIEAKIRLDIEALIREKSLHTVALMKYFKKFLQCLKELENNYAQKNFNDMDDHIITINGISGLQS